MDVLRRYAYEWSEIIVMPNDWLCASRCAILGGRAARAPPVSRRLSADDEPLAIQCAYALYVQAARLLPIFPIMRLMT